MIGKIKLPFSSLNKKGFYSPGYGVVSPYVPLSLALYDDEGNLYEDYDKISLPALAYFTKYNIPAAAASKDEDIRYDTEITDIPRLNSKSPYKYAHYGWGPHGLQPIGYSTDGEKDFGVDATGRPRQAFVRELPDDFFEDEGGDSLRNEKKAARASALMNTILNSGSMDFNPLFADKLRYNDFSWYDGVRDDKGNLRVNPWPTDQWVPVIDEKTGLPKHRPDGSIIHKPSFRRENIPSLNFNHPVYKTDNLEDFINKYYDNFRSKSNNPIEDWLSWGTAPRSADYTGNIAMHKQRYDNDYKEEEDPMDWFMYYAPIAANNNFDLDALKLKDDKYDFGNRRGIQSGYFTDSDLDASQYLDKLVDYAIQSDNDAYFRKAMSVARKYGFDEEALAKRLRAKHAQERVVEDWITQAEEERNDPYNKAKAQAERLNRYNTKGRGAIVINKINPEDATASKGQDTWQYIKNLVKRPFKRPDLSPKAAAALQKANIGPESEKAIRDFIKNYGFEHYSFLEDDDDKMLKVVNDYLDYHNDLKHRNRLISTLADPSTSTVEPEDINPFEEEKTIVSITPELNEKSKKAFKEAKKYLWDNRRAEAAKKEEELKEAESKNFDIYSNDLEKEHKAHEDQESKEKNGPYKDYDLREDWKQWKTNNKWNKGLGFDKEWDDEEED